MLILERPGTRQPQGAVGVASSFASDLQFAFTFANNTIDQARNKTLTLYNSPPYERLIPDATGLTVGNGKYAGLSAASFSPPITQWTYAFSAVTASNTGAHAFINAWDGAGSGRYIYIHITDSTFYVDIPYKQNILSATAPSANVAHRYLVTRNGDIVSAYIDGVLVDIDTLSVTQETPTSPFYFGYLTGGSPTVTSNMFGLIGLARGFSAAEARADFSNPWRYFAPRRIYIPTATAAASAPTITALSAISITATSAQPQITYA